ncbi:hypothetical protein GCM10010499_24520 [Streptomyces thermoviolaceus subsp. apingens]|nr:hypothetical protein GCM10010499_24520 [Streptomyces thermoviolaceus subsp. apingens]
MRQRWGVTARWAVTTPWGVTARSGVTAGRRPGDAGRMRALAVRAARCAVRVLRAEWHGIVVDPVRRLRRRGPSGLLLAFVAAFGVVFFHAIAQHPTGRRLVRLVGGVQGDLPLWLALLRTPVSLYVPALDLPVWGGLTQLFLAFALAELTLGRRRTLFLAYATTLAGTLSARVMLALGPGRWGLGLPPEAGRILDTGPSAAVVGLFTYLSVVRRAPVVFVLTSGSMVAESVLKPNLAGREHLIAVATAIVLASVHGRGRLLRPGRKRRTAGTGPPPRTQRAAGTCPPPAPHQPDTPDPAPSSRPGSATGPRHGDEDMNLAPEESGPTGPA